MSSFLMWKKANAPPQRKKELLTKRMMFSCPQRIEKTQEEDQEENDGDDDATILFLEKRRRRRRRRRRRWWYNLVSIFFSIQVLQRREDGWRLHTNDHLQIWILWRKFCYNPNSSSSRRRESQEEEEEEWHKNPITYQLHDLPSQQVGVCCWPSLSPVVLEAWERERWYDKEIATEANTGMYAMTEEMESARRRKWGREREWKERIPQGSWQI